MLRLMAQGTTPAESTLLGIALPSTVCSSLDAGAVLGARGGAGGRQGAGAVPGAVVTRAVRRMCRPNERLSIIVLRPQARQG